VQTSDSGYAITGWTTSFGAGGCDVYLVKTDAAGDTLWTRAYGGAGDDFGRAVEQTSDSGYIVVGYTNSFGGGGYNAYLIKTSASGDTLWTRTYGGADDDRGLAGAQTSDGGYIVAGRTASFGAGEWDVYLIKTNALGDTQWTRTYGDTYTEYGYSVRQTVDRGYIIAGITSSFGAGWYDVYLIRTNALGDTQWTRTWGGSNHDMGHSVLQTPDSGYIVAGRTSSFGAGSVDFYLIRTDALGDTLWTRTYGGTNDDEAYSVLPTSDGGYVIAGSTSSYGAGDRDVYLVKINASGDTLWTRTWGDTNADLGYSVQPTSDGGYVIAGSTRSFGSGSDDVYLIKTDSDGRVAVAKSSNPQRTNPWTALRVRPNPFSSFAVAPGHVTERFFLSDASGRNVGVFSGSRIGEGLPPGVYFLLPAARSVASHSRPLRVVKGS
jgi:hypothetical protein